MIEVKDEILLDRLKNGDIEILGTLYERYKKQIFNHFLRCTRDYDLSNDLLMETFERVYKYCHSFNLSKKVRPWIFQIAVNLLKDTYKTSNRFESIDKTKVTYTIEAQDTSIDESYKHKQLYNALDQLDPYQRNIISMYYLLEMSYEDIATTENMSINNARIKVCRSLKKLKEILKDLEL
ncbi:sigma-70 family RNA polymerase sigma factor [Winogradskyella sp.]|uniref:RNA polymerase sigma factor n=1 Tax=Winogradskyella sp. TaxID=1883156 RepID=UPI0026190CA9|nr:sigma-70 family RNA polymerase sigma factor [Winogradskyella sp.]